MEGRASSGRAAHGKEDPHTLPCDRPCGRTRVPSVRQLPTDHDYTASTREYQADQPSQKLPRSLPALLAEFEQNDSVSGGRFAGGAVLHGSRESFAGRKGGKEENGENEMNS